MKNDEIWIIEGCVGPFKAHFKAGLVSLVTDNVRLVSCSDLIAECPSRRSMQRCLLPTNHPINYNKKIGCSRKN